MAARDDPGESSLVFSGSNYSTGLFNLYSTVDLIQATLGRPVVPFKFRPSVRALDVRMQ